MTSFAVSQLLPFPDQYLDQCRTRNWLVESEDTHVPPAATEARALIHYLRAHKINATVVGSIGVLFHLSGTPEEGAFRPTHDLDLFVTVPEAQLVKLGPPPGWRADTESIGVISWISPSGGYVDFLNAGHEFPTGERVPHSVTTTANADSELPVAQVTDLFRLKLASMRTKDLTDLLSLAKAVGRTPSQKELGPLSDTQRENLDMISQWLALTLKRG